MTTGYMLDTTVFNHVLREAVDVNLLKTRGALFVTHIQFQEILATKNPDKREKLLDVFKNVLPSRIPAESALTGVSEWGEPKWGSENGLFEPMLADLNRRNNAKPNNCLDILLAEAALQNAFTLVTNDRDLADTVRAFNGETLTFQEFLG